MTKSILTITTLLLLACGCAGSHLAPMQQAADVESANRSANELGAQKNPQAQLHLKLAEEQLGKARLAMKDDDNERAESLLMRAKADAELAIALTREGQAKLDADEASNRSNAALGATTQGNP